MVEPGLWYNFDMDTRFTRPLLPASFTEGSFEIVCTAAPLSAAQKTAIKKACGRYTECRGHTDERRVTIPFREMALASRIIRDLGRRRPHDPRDHVTVLMAVWHTHPITKQTIYVRDLTPVFTVQSVLPDVENPALNAIERMVREINARRSDGTMVRPLALDEFLAAECEAERKTRREQERRRLVAERIATKLRSVSLDEAARIICAFSADMSNMANVAKVSAIIDEPIQE